MADPRTGRAIMARAIESLRRSWRSLAVTDLAYKAIAFALLSPATALLLRWIRASGAGEVVADTDILWFFVTNPAGVATLIVGLSLIVAITGLEAACLMAIGVEAAQGRHLDARSALAFGASNGPKVLALTARMAVRVLAALLPFLIAAGAVYWTLLREHDINYYLSQRPPQFFAAVVVVGVMVIAAAILLARTVARWALALPLVLFEEVSPRRALAESAKRSSGDRLLIVKVVSLWGLGALALSSVTATSLEIIGRGVAPRLAGSLALLIVGLLALALVGAAIALAVGIVNFSLFALSIVGLYLEVGEPRRPLPVIASLSSERRRLSGRARAAVAVTVVLAVLGAALLALLGGRGDRPVMVIAHRGSSAAAPENTLAAFRLAADEGADFVELDVQESADGEVLVVHDSDLMKVGGFAAKIWDATAPQLRAIDIGSHAGAQFAEERVPTLAESLAVCKGRCRVVVELKSYGHDQRLEERVAAIVEAAGMVDDCVYMSLDHDMVAEMKRLRPAWRSGALLAKALGDPTRLDADFLAVESKMATRRMVKRAHRAGKDVYVWTLNDAAAMLGAMSRGVDGLITDQPALAKEVVSRHAAMSDAQRLLVAVLVRLGVSGEQLAAEDQLRP